MKRSTVFPHGVSRRQFLAGSSVAALGLAAGRLAPLARAATAPVSVARCPDYGPELVPTLDRMFDQLGGLGRLVQGRTVAIKINLTGLPVGRVGTLPAGMTHWVHPRMIGAVAHLMGRAGARRIRLLESPWGTADPLEEYMYRAGWNAEDLRGAAPGVELVNTNWIGEAREYRRFDVPGGGLLFPSYLLNHSYHDCDVFVSLAKLKNHVTTGITLSMKNCFGNIPTTVYGDDVPEDEPLRTPNTGRLAVFHRGSRQPPSFAAPEIDPASPRHDGYRIPRVVVDLCGARPIDLAIIDGIATMGGSEGPWAGGQACEPKVLVAGTNCVNTDAVATAVMGYDPTARGGAAPFEYAESTLELGERVGLGTRDPARIEVTGTSIREARFDFASMAPSHRPRRVPAFLDREPDAG